MSPGEFVRELALFVGLAMVIASPVLAIAYRRGESRAMRGFLFASVIVGVVIAALSATSEALVSRCLDVGNTGCLDYGAVGIQTLILVLYGVASLVATVRLFRD